MVNPSQLAVPLRRCFATRDYFPKDQLIRLTFNRRQQKVTLQLPKPYSDGDFKPPHQENGRSIYITPTSAALREALKGRRLGRALKTDIPDDILMRLTSLLTELETA